MPPICCQILQHLPYKNEQAFFGAGSLIQTLFTSAVNWSSKNREAGLPTIATPTNSSLYTAPILNLCVCVFLLCLWCSVTNSLAFFKDKGITVKSIRILYCVEVGSNCNCSDLVGCIDFLNVKYPGSSTGFDQNLPTMLIIGLILDKN